MAQRRFHYEQAFEHYLRAKAVPYVAVDEAKRALMSQGARAAGQGLKSFDFVVYAQGGPNLLIDVKGRKHSGKTGRALQSWVTREDIRCMQTWAGLFGEGFEAAFVFLFWCDCQPPDALFLEVFEFGPRWYAALACTLGDYRRHTRPRSAKWDTVSVPAHAFHQITQPLGAML